MSSTAPAIETRTLERSVCASRTARYEVRLTPGLFGGNILDNMVDRLSGRSGLIVTTPTVAELYGRALLAKCSARGLSYDLHVIACSEDTKSLMAAEEICAAHQHRQLDRRSILVALGGGVCSDLVTVAASLIRRGTAMVRIPTTLIGQIDAAIGIKGAVNFKGKKSALGTFHAPLSVLVDPAFLRTLPAPHLRSGFAEIVKIAIIRDPALFALVEAHGPRLVRDGFRASDSVEREIIWRAIDAMLEELEPNLHEDRTYQRAVDFGHLFSPIVEARSHYGVRHGEAVAIDMAYSGAIAVEMGLFEEASWRRYINLLMALGLPVNSHLLDSDCWNSALDEAARHRGGQPNLVVPVAIGRTDFITDRRALAPSLLAAAKFRLAAAMQGR